MTSNLNGTYNPPPNDEAFAQPPQFTQEQLAWLQQQAAQGNGGFAMSPGQRGYSARSQSGANIGVRSAMNQSDPLFEGIPLRPLGLPTHEEFADMVADKVTAKNQSAGNETQVETSSAQKFASTMKPSDIGEPWQLTTSQDDDGNDLETLYASYELPDYRSAARMQDSCNYIFNCKDHVPMRNSITRRSGTQHDLEVQITTFSDSGVTRKDVLLANYINYLYHDQILRSEREDSYYDYWFSTPPAKRKENYRHSTETEDYLIPLDGIEFFEDSESNEQFKFKVPVARFGEWPHPIYKEVKFDQEDFDDIIRNFSDNVLGFEPPLFLGHPVDSNTSEGAPAEAFLLELTQEGEILFGIYEATDEQTFSDVKKGKFRYASAEIIRNHVSKRDGANVGTVLFGHALTNRPFIPDLPRVEAFSEGANPSRLFVPLSLDSPTTQRLSEMSNQIPTTPNQEPAATSTSTQNNAAAATPTVDSSQQSLATPATPAVPAQPPAAQTPTPAVTETMAPASTESLSAPNSAALMHQALSEMKAHYDQQLAEVRATALQSQQQLRDQVVNTRLAQINSLPLSAELKEQYSELVRTGQLGASEELFITSLSEVSNQFSESITTQSGVSTVTDQENLAQGDPNGVVNPYDNIIERNQSLARNQS